MEKNFEMVNHPSHYQSETGLEVIDVIEAFTFDLRGIEGFDTGNVIKYICRWKEKGGLTDLEKAKWYLEHLIAHVEHLEEENRQMKISTEEKRVEPLFVNLDISFSTEHDAKSALRMMDQLISDYQFATVMDLYDYIERPVAVESNNYGWADLKGAVITQDPTNLDFTLHMPRAIYLGENKKEND